MKLTKVQNPHNVAVGQVWKRTKRKDRPNKFTVLGFEQKSIIGTLLTVIVAVVKYGIGKDPYKRKINLLNFGNYTLQKK